MPRNVVWRDKLNMHSEKKGCVNVKDRNVEVKITGKQFAGTEAEDVVEFVTEGSIRADEHGVTLTYPESELSGFPGSITTLQIQADAIHMQRRDEEGKLKTEMNFKQGERMDSPYETPYGTMKLEVLTDRVDADLSDDGTGSIEVTYLVSLEGIAEGKNALHIDIQEVQNEREA
jgi:uncharacterized beta-barrel protein YwiB (DUF1934 family)